MVAFDAASNVAAGTGALSWTHTPVGTPRGILVLIVQNAGVTDEVTGVTYGGVAMAELTPDSPLLHTLGAEDGALYGYFLGSGVPTGAQTVSVSVNGTASSKRAVAVSVTAARDTEIEDAVTSEDSTGTSHSATLATAAGRETFVMGAIHCGALSTSIAPGADYTQILESTFTGAQTASWERRTSNATGGNVTVDWPTTVNEESGILAVAIREAVGGDATGSAKATVTAAGEKAASGSASCSAKATVTATAASTAASGSASCSAKARVTASGSQGPPSQTSRVAMII